MNVLIIEDRTKRQEQFLARTDVDISSFSFVDNLTGEQYKSFRDGVLRDRTILDKYDVIISHRSAFDKDNSKIMDILDNRCQTNNNTLILFSGGIYAAYYQEKPYEKLSINSQTFYSKNLELFFNKIESEKEMNLLLLAYGQNWQLNLVLNVLEKVNLYLSNYANLDDDDKSYDYFNDETDIEIIKSIIDIYSIENQDELSYENLKNIAIQLHQYVNKTLEIYDA